MPEDFTHDVFLSHSSKDKPIVRSIAERLKRDGLRIWFDEWEIRAGDSIPGKIEAGLQNSRVLVLCMSEHAFGSDWAKLESFTFRFRDPLNTDRRFIPLRLDETPIKDGLAQFLYISWREADREQTYPKLLEACRASRQAEGKGSIASPEQIAVFRFKPENKTTVTSCELSRDGKRVLLGLSDETMQMWSTQTSQMLHHFQGDLNNPFKVAIHPVRRVAWNADGSRGLSCTAEIVRVWDIHSGHWLRQMKEVAEAVLSQNGQFILTRSPKGDCELLDVRAKIPLKEFRQTRTLTGVPDFIALRPDQSFGIAGDSTGKLVSISPELNVGKHELNGHSSTVTTFVWSANQTFALSGSLDRTVRIWDMVTWRCRHVLEGHTGRVNQVAWSPDHRYVISGADDKTLRLWEVATGRCLRVFEGHTSAICTVAWSSDGRHVFSGDIGSVTTSSNAGGATIREWDVSTQIVPMGAAEKQTYSIPHQVQYTNAKVLIVGESGTGKTGLSMRLALNEWRPSDSTVGAWATQWKLSLSSDGKVEREIWLWDFGGQADQRLIHQLYMDETALAVLVFDGQKDDVFETLGQWDRDLTRASQKVFAKLLVAGRVDAGGLRISRNQVEDFAKERGYHRFLETSAKANTGCAELKEAVINGIAWENIPWRSSPVLFKRLKEEIVRLKDEGRVLMRFNELRETLRLRLTGELMRFTDDELKAVVTLLSGPGIVWELKFGNWILLQPECINAYAQAVILTMRNDEYERGCLSEEHVLNGILTYQSSIKRLGSDEERFVLIAMHQTLLERGLCLREQTEKGTLLIFPSFYRRERPDIVEQPAVLVSYRFNGFLEDIYATLVVRLHHVESFQRDQLWRRAADFKTLTGKRLGVKLNRLAEGAGELEVYFDLSVSMEEKIIFSKYVHEHLQKNARDVERLRHYACPHCETPVRNREVAMKKLAEGKKTIICVDCEKRIPLIDELEELFASPKINEQVRELEQQSATVLDNESRERTLVGEVISTVALAGQISREFSINDHGLDMEIEFKSDDGEVTGQKVYLILRSGNTHLKKKKRDNVEIFTIDNSQDATYWRDHTFPIFLLIRNAEGEARWMEIREYLKRESIKAIKKPLKQIIFSGERFDVMSVRRLRDKVLKRDKPVEGTT